MSLDARYKKIIKKSKLMIATPMYGGMCTTHYFTGMIKFVGLCARIGLSFEVKTTGNESLITKARNELAGLFMESDCTHLMWIDADTDFEPESILELLFLDKDVCTGIVPHKKIHWERIKQVLNKDTVDQISPYDMKILGNQYAFIGKEGRIETSKLFEIKHAGNAFLMTKRKVYEDFVEKFPKLWYTKYKKTPDEE